MAWTDEEARERVGRLDAALGELDGLPEPAAGTALTAVSGLVELYGEALGRIVAALPAATAQALAADELVGHLLMVHDLSPRPLAERVTAALDEVRPYLASHGGGVELVGVEGGVVRLELEGHCKGCPSSTATLRLAVEDAIRAAAPEVERIEADGAVEDAVPGVALPMAGAVPSGPPVGAWSTVVLGDLPTGGTVLREDKLFVRPNGSVYAYRPACAGCGASLAEAALVGTELTCAACGHRFDVAAAGRCVDAPELHLDPLPLLVADGGAVRVAS